MRLKPVRWLAEKTFGVARMRHSHHFRNRNSQLGSNITPSLQVHSRRGVKITGEKVVYFHGCSTQYYEPRVGIAAIRVLEINGFDVIVPRQNCCGLPLLSNGEFKAARKYHQGNVRSLVEYARQGIPIVGTSTSCTLTLKEEAPELLDMHDEDTRLVAKNTYDFNEFLLGIYNEGLLNLDLKTMPLELPYHIPCQYRAHRLGKPGDGCVESDPGFTDCGRRTHLLWYRGNVWI